ncbi:hypothetical protein D9M72_53140 [compost metagenome]
MVDVDHAGFQAVGDLGGGLQRVREHVGRQAEGQAVGAAQHFIGIGEADHGRDRTEGFFGHQHGVVGQVGHDGGGEEEALAVQRAAADHHLAAVLLGVVDEGAHGGNAAFMRQRAHVGAVFQTVADLDVLQHFGEAREELLVGAVLHVEAGGRHAHLAGVADLELGQHGGGAVDVGVVEHQHGRMAAQFHGDALHVGAGQGGQLLAHRHGSREGHLAHDRRTDQVVGDLGGFAPDDVQAALGQAGIVEHAGDRHDGAGRILGALQHHRAAGADGGGDLADGLVVREVPGRERGADADGFAHDDLAHVGVARRDHAAVDAAAFLGVPVGMLGAGGDFADGFGQRLALVQGHVAPDLLGALARQRRDLAQDGGALHGRGFLPGFEGALGGG